MAKQTRFTVLQSANRQFSFKDYQKYKQSESKEILNRVLISSAIESLLNGFYSEILQIQIQYGISSACAEGILFDQHTINQCTHLNHKDETFFQQLKYKPQTDLNNDYITHSFNYALRRLLLCSTCCSFCHKSLSIQSLRPTSCPESQSELCYFQSSQRDKNDLIVEYAVLNDGVVLDLLISLAASASLHGRMKVFPRELMCTQKYTPDGHVIMDGKGKYRFMGEFQMEKGDRLEVYTGTERIMTTVESVHQQPQSTFQLNPKININSHSTISVFRDRFLYSKQTGENYKLLNHLIQMIPSIHHLSTLLQKGQSLRHHLNDIDCLVYPLLKWIYTSNRAILQLNNQPRNQVFPSDPTLIEFFIHLGSVEKESQFQSKNEECIKRGRRSLLGFHGSPVWNWHDILRLGLNYEQTVNGRVYGNGVYHAYTLEYALHYAHGGAQHQQTWINSQFQIQNIITISELVNDPKHIMNWDPLVVNDVGGIQSRYLLLRGGMKEPVVEVDGVEMSKYQSGNRISYHGRLLEIPQTTALGLFTRE